MRFQTKRLNIRELTTDDALFIFDLLNSEGFKKNIGDREIKTIKQAEEQITSRYISGYPDYGMFVVELRSNESELKYSAIGGVTLINRDELPCPDLGYAFLPQFSGNGYAYEASVALMKWAKEKGMNQLCAIVQESNSPSIKLLTKLGFKSAGIKKMTDPVETLSYFEYKA